MSEYKNTLRERAGYSISIQCMFVDRKKERASGENQRGWYHHHHQRRSRRSMQRM